MSEVGFLFCWQENKPNITIVVPDRCQIYQKYYFKQKRFLRLEKKKKSSSVRFRSRSFFLSLFPWISNLFSLIALEKRTEGIIFITLNGRKLCASERATSYPKRMYRLKKLAHPPPFFSSALGPSRGFQ